ncbi:MAG: DUF1203 domain-containing protein [Gammaproteobacteria bacterium]|nr:DUF1203 domain-containing protein [Gammaproteobacteria bacterium]
MDFTIRGLPLEHCSHLLDADDETLRAAGVTVCTADAPHAYPCRVTLEDAVPGEEVLLLSYAHQPGPSPYAASGPIFVRRKATARLERPNFVPDQQRRRLLSVRAYDHRDWLVDADIVPGSDLESLIERFFASPDVAYLHVHNARPGCYACRVDRG